MDIRELDRRAMAVTAKILYGVTSDQMDNPTPCGQWSLRDLLAHIVGQYHGFALAASGEPTGVEAFRPRPVGDELHGTYAAAASLVNEAFAEDGVMDRKFYLPEIRDGGPYPAPMAIGFHFVDEVVHAWDLAKAIGAPAEFDGEVLATALSISGQVPNDPAVRGAGFAFTLAVNADPSAPTLDRIVALLGRRSDWTPAR
ncbi:MAG: TIGR03086 family protein [Acidimicrobiales bacterium]|nr:MAG: TIGR03086 family protein [Acidimicrobiales bacterium]